MFCKLKQYYEQIKCIYFNNCKNIVYCRECLYCNNKCIMVFVRMNFYNLWGFEFIFLYEKFDCYIYQFIILILFVILCGVSWILDFKKIIYNENYLRFVFLC